MQQIAVLAVRLGRSHRNRNAVILGVIDKLGTGFEFPFTPGCNHLDAGLHGISGQLETHLIVTLAGGAVTNSVGLFSSGNLNQALADQRTRNGSTQQIRTFVNRVGLHHRENEIPRKLFRQVLDIALGGAGANRFSLNTVEFFGLSDIGTEPDDFRFVSFLDPLDNHRGVKSARISYYYFHVDSLNI